MARKNKGGVIYDTIKDIAGEFIVPKDKIMILKTPHVEAPYCTIFLSVKKYLKVPGETKEEAYENLLKMPISEVIDSIKKVRFDKFNK